VQDIMSDLKKALEAVKLVQAALEVEKAKRAMLSQIVKQVNKE